MLGLSEEVLCPSCLQPTHHYHRSFLPPSSLGNSECDRIFFYFIGIFRIFIYWNICFFVVELLSHVRLFCSPMDCSLPGSSVHEISQGRILEWVAMPLLQGIFPTQGSNLCLLHWQMNSLPLSHHRSQVSFCCTAK